MRERKGKREEMDQAWALRIRSLHGFPLSPLRNTSAATPGIEAAVALCAVSMARIVANSRRRIATYLKVGE
jgi:hypothetical protein